MKYYIVTYQKNLVVICFVLLAAYGLIYALKNKNIRLRNVLSYRYHVFRGKLPLTLLVCLILIVNLIVTPAQAQFNNSAVISLNYSSASSGLNPNGTRFNQTDMLSDKVLEKAIKKGAFENIGADDLKKTLRVVPVVQAENIEDQEYYISTQFRLMYEASRDTRHLDGRLVVQMVAEAYKEYFIETYSDNISILNLDFEKYNENDYLDIVQCLTMTANEIGQYMTEMSYEEPAFQSSVSNETFGSVADSAYSIGSVMTENLEAHILENAVSKEKGIYLGRLLFENQNLDFDAQKESMSNQNNLYAIEMYENDMARTVLVPTYDTEAQFYMSRTKIGVDDFAEAAEEHAAKMTSLRSEIASKNYVYQMLSAKDASPSALSKADALVLQIEGELITVAEKAKALVKEYGATQANQYMTISIPSAEMEMVKNLVYGLLYTLLLAVGLHFVTYTREFEKNDERRDTK